MKVPVVTDEQLPDGSYMTTGKWREETMKEEAKRIRRTAWMTERELEVTVQGRVVLVRATVHGLIFRQKGRHKGNEQTLHWEKLAGLAFGPGFVRLRS